MLIEFSVANYLSFKNMVTLSMVTSSINEHMDTNTFENAGLSLLKSAVIYGANASGKSNLFSALGFMKYMVTNSSKESQANEQIEVDSFKLSTETEHEPSYFEVVFLHENIRYRYGFETDSKKIHREWLYRAKTNREARLFIRENTTSIEIGSYFKEGKGLEDKTRDNALFLSVVAQFNGGIAKKVMEWFTNLRIITGNRDYLDYTAHMLKDTKYKDKILKLMKVADLGIEDVAVKKVDLSDAVFPSDMPKSLQDLLMKKGLTNILTYHKKYDAQNKFNSIVQFDLERIESEGTKKFFGLSAPIIDVLLNGRILIIDELDAKLHPLLTREIVKLFHSSNNHFNAQLIFATHDTNHLNRKYFRRDQIWFVEKDQYGCSDVYSLVEYKIDDTKIRNDASFEKDYIRGKYGAIPYIGSIDFLEEDHGE